MPFYVSKSSLAWSGMQAYIFQLYIALKCILSSGAQIETLTAESMLTCASMCVKVTKNT